MKKAIAAAVLALGATQAQAAPCVSDTLTNYISMGSCEIGSNTLTDFAALTTIPTGATLVAPATITVTPVFASAFGFGLDFGIGGLAATPGAFLDFLGSYRVAGNNYARTSLLVDGVPAPDGVLTAIADICPAGTFPTGIGSCTSGVASQMALAQLVGDGPQMDQLALALPGSIAVITDIGIDTGSVGDISLVVVGNRFAVPAPSVPILLLGGLAALGLSSRIRRRAIRDSNHS